MLESSGQVQSLDRDSHLLISCLCVTRNRVDRLKQAIHFFQQQTYPHKELVILYEEDDLLTAQFIDTEHPGTKFQLVELPIDSGNPPPENLAQTQWDFRPQTEIQNLDRVKNIGLNSGSIRAIEVVAQSKKSLGILRNLSVHYSTGDYICQWDDDDWYRDDRLSVQMQALQQTEKLACALSRWFMYDQVEQKAYRSCTRKIGWEGSLLCHKSALTNYADQGKAEDTIVLENLLAQDQLLLLDRPEIYVYIAHDRNTWERDHFKFLVSLSEELPPEIANTLSRQYA